MANTQCVFLNNYQTTLGAAFSSTATTMTVSSVVGLPALTTGQFIPMTLTPASSPGSAYEIVYVTGISGSNLTVERGQENTSALNWNTGDILYSTNTADTTFPATGSPSAVIEASSITTDTLTASGLITANGGIIIPNASSPDNPVALAQSTAGAVSTNVASSRVFGTVYTNTSDRLRIVQIFYTQTTSGTASVLVYKNGSGTTINAGGYTVGTNSNGATFFVLPGESYQIDLSAGTATIISWNENI